jgi:hypothetical protein
MKSDSHTPPLALEEQVTLARLQGDTGEGGVGFWGTKVQATQPHPCIFASLPSTPTFLELVCL